MKKFCKFKKFFLISFCFLVLGSTIFISTSFNLNITKSNKEIKRDDVFSNNKSQADDVVYLSDIPYQKAQIGWGTLGLDKTNSNTSLILNIEGSSVVVKKGIFAHATSNSRI